MNKLKEVRFDLYCSKCLNETLSEHEDPCDECLAQGWNDESHKPIRFKPKEEDK